MELEQATFEAEMVTAIGAYVRLQKCSREEFDKENKLMWAALANAKKALVEEIKRESDGSQG